MPFTAPPIMTILPFRSLETHDQFKVSSECCSVKAYLLSSSETTKFNSEVSKKSYLGPLSILDVITKASLLVPLTLSKPPIFKREALASQHFSGAVRKPVSEPSSFCERCFSDPFSVGKKLCHLHSFNDRIAPTHTAKPRTF